MRQLSTRPARLSSVDARRPLAFSCRVRTAIAPPRQGLNAAASATSPMHCGERCSFTTQRSSAAPPRTKGGRQHCAPGLEPAGQVRKCGVMWAARPRVGRAVYRAGSSRVNGSPASISTTRSQAAVTGRPRLNVIAEPCKMPRLFDLAGIQLESQPTHTCVTPESRVTHAGITAPEAVRAPRDNLSRGQVLLVRRTGA